jgi:hypothetical protein
MRSVRLSSIARSASAILTSANLLNTTATHVNDTDTWALWKMDELPDAIDVKTSTPLCATFSSASLFDITSRINSHVGPSGRGKHFSGINGAALSSPSALDDMTVNMRTTLANSFTYEAWLQLEGNTVGRNGLFYLYDPSGSQISAYINYDGSAAYDVVVKYINSSGSSWNSYTASKVISRGQMKSDAVHLAITKGVSGGAATWKVYVNGSLVDTSSAMANYDGIGSTSAKFFLCKGVLV